MSLNAISNDTWQNIECFLHLEDTISVAQTCKSLHSIIVDATTRKVRISHFTAIKKDIYHLILPWALEHIDFPSLKRLQYPPLSIKPSMYEEDYTDDAKRSTLTCFPMFVRRLSEATNLENLKLGYIYRSRAIMHGNGHDNEDDDSVISYGDDRGICCDIRLINELGRNLQCCIKLKELDVYISGTDWIFEDEEHQELEIEYGIVLLQALTPSILQARNELEKLVLDIEASQIITDDWIEERGDYPIMNKFFDAVLSARKLKDLDIFCRSTLVANSLLKVAADQLKNDIDLHRPELRSLALYINVQNEATHREQFEQTIPFFGRGLLPRRELLPVVPLLKNLSNCPSIEKIGNLLVPSEFWEEEESTQAYGKLLKNKPMLKKVQLDYYDRSSLTSQWNHGSTVMNTLDYFAIQCMRNTGRLEELSISHISQIKASDMQRLAHHLETFGLTHINLNCFNMGTYQGPINSASPLEQRRFDEVQSLADLDSCSEDDNLELLCASFLSSEAHERWEEHRLKRRK